MDERTEQRARELARIIAEPHADAACQACLDGLDGYVEAQLAGQAYTALMPAVAQHLDACVACAESYALLYEGRLAEAEAPAAIPAPDLSFLAPRRPGLAELVAAAVERTGAGLRLRLSRPLLDALTAARGPALVLRERPDGDPLLELILGAPTPTVAELHLSVYPNPAAPGSGLARAQVRIAGRDWPDLGGVRVTIGWEGGAAQALTDAWGEALIPGLPLDRLAELTLEVAAPQAR